MVLEAEGGKGFRVAQRNLCRLTELVATEQNNWVILDRRTVMKCSAVTASVLTVLEKDIECSAKSITVVICGLQEPMDCELVFIKGEKEISKSC